MAVTEAKAGKKTPAKVRGVFYHKGAYWICYYCTEGHKHRKRVGCHSLAVQEHGARRKEVEKARRLGQTYCPDLVRKARPILLHDYAKQYLAWAKEQRPRSYAFRDKALIHLKAAFGSRPLSTLTRTDVETYQRHRRAAGAAPATVNRERAVLSHLFNRAIKTGMPLMNPVAGTEPEDEANEKPRPLTYDEELKLFAVLPAHYKPFVTLALNTGLRLGELQHQAWRDINLENRVLHVTRPKSERAPREIPLNATAYAILVKVERTKPIVFPELPKKLTDLFKRYVAKAKLPTDITFHCLRDTFISRLAPHVSPTTLMRLARHRDFKTTQRYIGIEEDHLRAAVETLALPPSISAEPDRTARLA